METVLIFFHLKTKKITSDIWCNPHSLYHMWLPPASVSLVQLWEYRSIKINGLYKLEHQRDTSIALQNNASNHNPGFNFYQCLG